MSSNGDKFFEQPPADEEVPPLADAPLAPGARAPQATTVQRTGGFRRWTMVAAAGLVVLALIGGGAVYGLSLLLHAASASVTILPKSSDVKQTFPLTGVLGTPNAAQQQVGARLISVTTPAQSQSVPTTGQQTTPGTHAHGTVFVVNYDSSNPLTLAAGTYPNNAGCAPSSVTMVLDATVNLPAAAPGSTSSTIAPAHILQVGPVPAGPPNCAPALNWIGGSRNCGLTGNNGYCAQISATTGVWTDGTNPQTVMEVAQSDLDNAVNSLIQANQPDAQRVLQSQLQPNERLAGTSQCSPNVSADHKAGDAASQVTVTVSFTCTGEAYDHDGALALAGRLLMDQTASVPGAGYALTGRIKKTLLSATPAMQGSVQIMVQAEGIWVYQFSASQKQALARLIAGKSQQEAQRLLTSQPGVSQATITLSGLGQTLPADPSQIPIAVQPISGLG